MTNNPCSVLLRRFSSPLLAVVMVMAFSLSGLSGVAAEPPGSTDELVDSLASIETFAANFEQARIDSRGNVARESAGKFAIARPDRFHWRYETPHVQELTASGGTLWVYEPDLRQATRSPLDSGTAAPIAILMGDRPIEDVFRIRELGRDDGELGWFALEPREESGDFREVLLGLDGSGLKEMRFIDQLDQTTRVVLSQRQFNRPVDDDRFRFDVPEGVDVVEAREPPRMQ